MDRGILNNRCLTQRAADKWDSARFSSLFLALSFSGSPAESQPAHLRLTPAVRQFLLKDQRLKISKQGPCIQYGIAV